MPVFAAGTSYFIRKEKHLRFIISDPTKDDEKLVVVNFTTFHQEFAGDADNDTACMVYVGEHSFVDRTTCVYYADNYDIPSITYLQHCHSKGEIRFHDLASDSLLSKMRQGAAVSDHISFERLDILIEQGLVG